MRRGPTSRRRSAENNEEPEPTEEFMAEDPQGAWIEQIPLQCVIEAYKFKP